MSEKKIFVITFPLVSHLNAFVNVLSELGKTPNLKLIAYGSKKCEKLLAKAGCEFREYENFEELENIQINSNKTRIEKYASNLHKFLTLNSMNLVKIATEIEREKPGLILFDAMSLLAKWIIRFLKKNYETFLKNPNSYLLTKSAPPPAVIYYTGFFMNKIEQQAKDENNYLSILDFLRGKIFDFFIISKILIRTKCLSIKYGLDFIIPAKEIFENENDLMHIVLTIPEIQPNHNLLPQNVKFVGPCLSDSLRIKEQCLTDDTPIKLKRMLELFKSVNPTHSYESLINEENNRLFYVSL